MKKRLIGAIISVLLIVGARTAACNCAHAESAVSAPEKSDSLAKPLLDKYLKIRVSLAADGTDGVAESAAAIMELVKKPIAESEKVKKNTEYAKRLAKIRDAAKPLTGKKIGLEPARAAFGPLTDAVIAYTAENVSAKDAKEYQLFYCSMAKKH